MKKLFGILVIIFTFVMTSFSQNRVYDTDFSMTVDNVPTDNFTVTHNLSDPVSPGTIIILFKDALNVVNFQIEDGGEIDAFKITEHYKYPINKLGIKMVEIDINYLNPGVINITSTSFDEDNYLITVFNAQDTLNSWNEGMELGYYAGVESVDTMKYYNMGVNSIDTQYFYVMGVNSVVVSDCDTLTPFYNGQMSVNTDSIDVFYNIGFIDGQTKSAQTTTSITKSSTTNIGLNVYPNPVNNGEYVNITCDFFSHVDVYDLMGKKVISDLDTPFVPTDGLLSGMYVFVVWNMDNNTDIAKVLVK